MKKILIAGIGGTGGFFGGKLAYYYFNSADTEVYFLCRGENLNVIREKGLQVESEDGTFTVHPKLATDNSEEFGTVDLLICCTKTYDLEQTLQQLNSCIDSETVILPLQNGVDSFERVQKLYPQNEIWRGCVYIVSRLVKPGLVVDSGNIRKLFFGTLDGTSKKLPEAENLFKEAGIDTTLSQNILQTTWEKFIFISAMASLTSYQDKTIGQVFEDPESCKLLYLLLTEIRAVANAKGILFSENSIEKTIDKMKTLSYQTTSSMHSDFQNNKQTEVESLIGYVIKQGRQNNIATPTYEMIYRKLK